MDMDWKEKGRQAKEDLAELRDEVADWLAHGRDHFWGLAAGSAILVGLLWLAISTSAGGG